MEPSQSIPEYLNDAISSTTVEEQHQESRPFVCSFCNNGFCNARALGGHMKIHRKQKATAPTFSPPPNTATPTTPINPFTNSAQGRNKPRRFVGDVSCDSRNNHQENVMIDHTSPTHEIDVDLRLGQYESSGSKITTTRKFF
ncbi:unnamed protein product [Lactuca virosa]|uniref:C2H2-type domain-containing protein n=1 Tax=Lactuca virosa TaxID=75947 RepID=A0AAU9LTI1_9ASTR|nr:unnamed protein product [Lactuca virosa]